MTKYENIQGEKTFNGKQAVENEVIVPVVLTESMKMTLKPHGLKKEYVRYWKIRNVTKKVPIVFMSVSKDEEEASIKFFNFEIKEYLNQYSKDEALISLDSLLNDLNDSDKQGYDPTGTTKINDDYFYDLLLLDLLNKLSQIDDKMSQCINMLAKGYKKREILESLDLGLAKTQGYEFIKKAQNLSKKIINGDL